MGSMSSTAPQLENLLDELRRLDVSIHEDAGRLRLDAPAGALTDQLKQSLRENKAALVDYLRQKQQGPVLTAIDRDGPLPLSFAQERMWVIADLTAATGAYNIPLTVALRGPLDISALDLTVRDLQIKHEILRTCFAAEPTPHPVIEPDPGQMLPLVDLSGLAEAQREVHARRLLTAAVDSPFDLHAGPPRRYLLLRLTLTDHRFVFCLHHILADGWSIQILAGDLARIYGTHMAGAAVDMSPAPLQYVDFAAWQRRVLAGQKLDSMLDYWRHQLAGAPDTLTVPADYPRPAARSYRGASYAFTLADAAAARRCQALCQHYGVTTFMFLGALWSVLLARLNHADDAVFGTPVANRTHPAIESMIGFFVNTLVIRTDLRGNPSFRGLLEQFKQTAMAAYDHQDLPFEKLVEHLTPRRDPSRSPLFQVLFHLMNLPPGQQASAEVGMQVLGTAHTTAKFDMTLMVQESENGIRVQVEYATDLYMRESIETLGTLFHGLLQAAITAPEQPVNKLALLDPAAKAAMQTQWSTSAQRGFPDADLPSMLTARRNRGQDQVLMSFQSAAEPDQWGQMTAAALHRQAQALAWRLREAGAKGGDIVAVWAGRGPSFAVGVLAAIKAGLAYLPVAPEQPAERVRGILTDAGVRLSIGPRTAAAEACDAHACLGDRDRLFFCANEPQKASRPVPTEWAQPAERLAYVIYTSGSSGRPKGVMVPVSTLADYVAGLGQWSFLTDGGRFLHVSSLAADLGSTLWFYATAHRGSIAIPARGTLLEPAAFARAMQAQMIDGFKMVPSHFRQMAAGAGVRAVAPRRFAIFSGEATAAADLRAWRQACPHLRVANSYGPTEVTVNCFLADLNRHGLADPGVLPLGEPLPSVMPIVLDERLEPVVNGLPGDLYLGGQRLGWGYLGNPGLTARRFLPDAFSGQFGARLYQTGDRVRRLNPDRWLFLNRSDLQVKIRGNLVEPREVEAALLGHPGIEQVTVVALVDRDGTLALAAAYTGHSDALYPGPAEFLQGLLPGHMVPSRFLHLRELPLNANGKIDRSAVTAQLHSTSTEPAGAGPEVTLTTTEALVANIWEAVLERPVHHADTDFFAAGGHSLKLFQVAARIRQIFDLDVPIRELFLHHTVGALARRLGQLQRTAQDQLLPTLQPRPVGQAAPLSFAQQRLWILDRLEGGSAVYNLPYTVRLQGPLSTAGLERAFDRIVQRHESLRSSFRQTSDGDAEAAIHELTPTLRVLDLSLMDDELQADWLARWLALETHRPFDLATPPLFRCLLIRTSPDDHRLAVTLHHIVSDGWSTGILIRELVAGYRTEIGLPARKPVSLPVQYGDYAAWQRSWLQDEQLQAQLTFWKNYLAGAPALLDLPIDRPRQAVQRANGAVYRFELPASLLQNLQGLSRQYHTTLFMNLLAGFQILLARYSGQPDVVVGTPVANRTQADTERLIGFFVNTLCMRLRPNDFSETGLLLQSLRRDLLSVYAHQDLPFEKLVDELRPRRATSHSPLFQVMMVLQNQANAPFELPGVAAWHQPVTQAIAKFDITLLWVETAHGLIGTLEYRTDLFDRETMARMARHLTVLYRALAETPRAMPAKLPLMEDGERRDLLAAIHDQTGDYPDDKTIDRLFSDQAILSPDAIAVVQDHAQLSYAFVDRLTNGLAGQLQAMGVEPEDRVAVLSRRIPLVPAAILAILKTGATYVPLDPDYPPARTAWMLEDSGTQVLFTDQEPPAETTVDQVIHLDRWVRQLQTEPPAIAVNPDRAAYLIYTSGSTGIPKGVTVAHRGLCNLAQEQFVRLATGPGSRILQCSSPCFDASIWEIVMALGASGALVLPTGRVQPDETLAQWLTTWAITHLTMPPSALSLLPEEAFTSVDTVVTAGEACPPALVTRLAPLCRFFNAYGPTESTICATMELCREEDPQPLIGKSLTNLTVVIIDSFGEVVPDGVPGELCIGGLALARGYHQRPQRTAASFVPDSFSGQAGARLYRTGDRARRLVDGRVQFLGRIDTQVKLRGFRIEPGEIEAALSRLADVRAAAVTVRDHDEVGNGQLVAYVVPEEVSAALDLNALRDTLTERLPHYLVPHRLLPVAALPATPNGKVDYRALAEVPILDQQNEGAVGRRAPRNDQERAIAAAWLAELGIANLGIDDNFFEIGGDSLMVIRVGARLKKAGWYLPARATFEKQTIAGLAPLLVPYESSRAVTLVREEQDGPVPLVPVQAFFFQRNLPNMERLTIAKLFSAPASLDEHALRRAAAAVMRHHDALTMTFQRPGGVWQQWARDTEALPEPFVTVDLTDTGPEGLETVIHEQAVTVQNSLSLSDGPLFKVALFHLPEPAASGSDDDQIDLPPAEVRVLLVVHHLVVDGFSFQLLIGDLVTAYFQYAEDEPLRLPDSTARLQDWAWQLADFAASGSLTEEQDFWLDSERVQAPSLPRELTNDLTRNTRGSTTHISLALGKGMTNHLQRTIPKSMGVRITDVLMWALTSAFHRWSGQPVIRVDLVGHGREPLFDDLDLSRTVGCLSSIYPVRLELDPAGSPMTTCRGIQAQMEAVPNMGIGYGMLRYLSKKKAIRQALDDQPQAEIHFNYIGQLQKGGSSRSLFGMAPESIDRAHNHDVVRPWLFNIHAGSGPNGLTLDWHFSANLYRPETVTAIAAHFETSLHDLVQAILTQQREDAGPVDWYLP